MSVPLFAWIAIAGGLTSVAAVDFWLSCRHSRYSGLGECAAHVAAYVLAAMLFALVLRVAAGSSAGGGFLMGWAVSYLSVINNVLVFVVLTYGFAVPRAPVLAGIVLGVVSRSVFGVVGIDITPVDNWIFCAFGVLLLYLGWRLFDRAERDEPPARWPAWLILVGGSVAAVLFAWSSSRSVAVDPGYLVATASALAMLGFRPLFVLFRRLLSRAPWSQTGVAVISAFIGVTFLLDVVLAGEITAAPGVFALCTGVLVTVLVVSASPVRQAIRREEPDPG